MAKESKKVISFNAKDINLKDVITNGPSVGYDVMLATNAIIKAKIEEIDAIAKPYTDAEKFFKSTIKSARYDDIISQLVAAGKLDNADEKPVIAVEIPQPDGTSLTKTVTLSAKSEDAFEIDPTLNPTITDMVDKILLDPETKTKMDPQLRKYITINLDHKRIKEDFDAGILPTWIQAACTCSPVESTAYSIRSK